MVGLPGNVIAEVPGDRARPQIVLAAGAEADHDLDGLALEEFGGRLGGGDAAAHEQQSAVAIKARANVVAFVIFKSVFIPDVLQEPFGRQSPA